MQCKPPPGANRRGGAFAPYYLFGARRVGHCHRAAAADARAS